VENVRAGTPTGHNLPPVGAPPATLTHVDRDELEAVTRAPSGRPCMGIVAWDIFAPPFGKSAIHCGSPATVDVGFLACDEHGAQEIARRCRMAQKEPSAP
jgi:hypothetical protein